MAKVSNIFEDYLALVKRDMDFDLVQAAILGGAWYMQSSPTFRNMNTYLYFALVGGVMLASASVYKSYTNPKKP